LVGETVRPLTSAAGRRPEAFGEPSSCAGGVVVPGSVFDPAGRISSGLVAFSDMKLQRRSWIWLIALVVIVIAVLVYAETRPPGQRQVSTRLLPLAASARVTTTYVDCSTVGLVAYDAQRPCDTYFLIGGHEVRSPAALLQAEQQELRTAGWRYARAATWGQLLDSHGWIAPDHSGCAVVMTAASGSRAMTRLNATSPMGRKFIAFSQVARLAGRTSTLEALLQPGYDSIGRPRC
jgi:hypothetical protein